MTSITANEYIPTIPDDYSYSKSDISVKTLWAQSPEWKGFAECIVNSMEARMEPLDHIKTISDEIYSHQRQTVAMQPKEVQLMCEIIDILQECSDENWDGYGASPVNMKSVKHVLGFINQLPPDIPWPELGPEPSGNLTMSWKDDERTLIVAIDKYEDGDRFSWVGINHNKKLNIHGRAPYSESNIPEHLIDTIKHFGNL